MSHAKKHLNGLLLVTLVVCLLSISLPSLADFSPSNPIAVTVWTYYTGPRQEAFDSMVNAFNETAGLEKGIAVEAKSFGSMNDLTDNLMAAAAKQTGSYPMPNLFFAYGDTAFEVEQMIPLATAADYFTQAEKDSYIDSFWQSGDFRGDGKIKIIPVAKSTELLYIDENRWDLFAEQTGADKADLLTYEGILKLAEMYYQWTDAQTETPDDGKAFFGRDSLSNYMLLGANQLGHDMFTIKEGALSVDLDKATLRKLWDHYYVPAVKGWFYAGGRFRSDDLKGGEIMAYIGSTSGASYFPKEVAYDANQPSEARAGVYAFTGFENMNPIAVQQGAGIAIIQSTKDEEAASAEFIKWFTAPEQNMAFSISSGYLPVTKKASQSEALVAYAKETKAKDVTVQTLEKAAPMISSWNLYAGQAFKNAYGVRKILDDSFLKAVIDAQGTLDVVTKGGGDRKEALKQQTNDEQFEKWFAFFAEAVQSKCNETGK